MLEKSVVRMRSSLFMSEMAKEINRCGKNSKMAMNLVEDLVKGNLDFFYFNIFLTTPFLFMLNLLSYNNSDLNYCKLCKVFLSKGVINKVKIMFVFLYLGYE